MTKRTRHKILSSIGLVFGIWCLLSFGTSLPANLGLLQHYPAHAIGALATPLLLALGFFYLCYWSSQKVDEIDAKELNNQKEEKNEIA